MSKKILVVEDERPIAQALELKLKSEGFEPDMAYDGEEALEKMKKGEYALVILDLVLPKLDGFAVLEAAKKENITTPIIVASNLSQPEDEEKAKSLGAKDFLIKSNTTIAAIVEKVKSHTK